MQKLWIWKSSFLGWTENVVTMLEMSNKLFLAAFVCSSFVCTLRKKKLQVTEVMQFQKPATLEDMQPDSAAIQLHVCFLPDRNSPSHVTIQTAELGSHPGPPTFNFSFEKAALHLICATLALKKCNAATCTSVSPQHCHGNKQRIWPYRTR